eukprot:TRINITY_DN29830_c0_g1_i4.p1 TRINITY_DN29830_c0_g1~~TRINITY_DN29830_c0_g1_i4.p1  ORF type:complete len:473 (-),score=28.77 TRINITY_DN29830_c0_g1_i4:106-1524(-)
MHRSSPAEHTRRSLPHQSLQASANMPVPLLPEDVERLEQGSQVLHRKDGHAKLREFREQLQDTLRNMVAPEILEDWTDREWPWQKFIAGLSEKVRDTVVGDGVKRFGIRVQRNILCPYTGEPQVNFLITRLNDTRVIHHPHQDRDEPLRFEFADGRPIDHPARDRHAEIRAFRLATEWSTRNRWPACVPNAFQTVLRCFKAERRPDGWQDDDFYFAHELSSFKLSRALQADFLQWLSNQFGRPWTQDIAEAESRSRQRSRSPMASRQHARDDVPPPCYPEDMAWWLTPPHRHPKRFTSVQVHWLKDAVKQHCAYDFRRHLDPSVPGSWAMQACEGLVEYVRITDGRLRYAHDRIRSTFRQGNHADTSLEDTVRQLCRGQLRPLDFPAIVAVEHDGKYYVVMGNRRLHCVKEYANADPVGARDCHIKVIVHRDCPRFSRLPRWLRPLMALKAVDAMSSQNDGSHVSVIATLGR